MSHPDYRPAFTFDSNLAETPQANREFNESLRRVVESAYQPEPLPRRPKPPRFVFPEEREAHALVARLEKRMKEAHMEAWRVRIQAVQNASVWDTRCFVWCVSVLGWGRPSWQDDLIEVVSTTEEQLFRIVVSHYAWKPPPPTP